MRSTTKFLNAIEAYAENAIVQELRLMTQEVLQLSPFLSPEDQDHYHAVLLKLRRLESDHVVEAAADATLEQRPQQVAQAA